MSAYIIPVLFLLVLAASFIKRREPYGGFIDGARQAVDLTINVFPYLLAVMVAVEAFRVSGASGYLATAMEPVLGAFGLPKELAELMFLRPVSGAGSLAILDGIYTAYGPDGVLYFDYLLFAIARAQAALRHSRCARRYVYGLYSRLRAVEIFLKANCGFARGKIAARL